MHSLRQLAVPSLLFAATAACAQVQSPDVLAPHAPRNPAHSSTTRDTASNQWLWTFTHPAPVGQMSALRVDPRFQVLLLTNFKQPQAMWGGRADAGETADRPSLAQIIPLFVDRYGEALAVDNRYFVADGCVPSFCAASGLLWIDNGASKHPLMLFAATNWSAQGHTTNDANAEYTLWVFANRTLTADEIPFAFTSAISAWNARLAAAHRLVPHVNHALLIEPDGAPVPLDPLQLGCNSLPPQPDTVTPKTDDLD